MLVERTHLTEQTAVSGQGNEVARAARVVDWLKAELVAGVGNVLRLSVRGREDALLDGLADLVMQLYLLARRLGISWSRLEMRVLDRIRLNILADHQLEQWYGDMTGLESHFRKKGLPPEQ